MPHAWNIIESQKETQLNPCWGSLVGGCFSFLSPLLKKQLLAYNTISQCDSVRVRVHLVIHLILLHLPSWYNNNGCWDFPASSSSSWSCEVICNSWLVDLIMSMWTVVSITDISQQHRKSDKLTDFLEWANVMQSATFKLNHNCL